MTDSKKGDEFRDYSQVRYDIQDNYRMARTHQTYEFVQERIKEYKVRPKVKIPIWDALNMLNNFVDKSDPDIETPNLYHLLQTAEGMRQDGLPEWMQVTGLIHDLGKLMYKWGSDDTGTSIDQQWAIVGDTFVVGCPIPDSIVFSEFNALNPDSANPKFSSPCGIYDKNCGLSNVHCSWSHDEFMYQTIKDSNLPDEAKYIIRFHSLYLVHTNGEYRDLMNDYDKKILQYLQQFNKYDLYTKADIDKDKLGDYYDQCKPYYTALLQEYIGDYLMF